jgi:hypothetical protein
VLYNGTKETLKGKSRSRTVPARCCKYGHTRAVHRRDGHCLHNAGQEEVREERQTVALHSSKRYRKFTVSSPTHSTVVVSGAQPFGGRQKQLPIAAHTQLVDLVTCMVEPPGRRWLGRGGGSFQT